MPRAKGVAKKVQEPAQKRQTRGKKNKQESDKEAEPQVGIEKTKPIVKAKKYKNKTYDELSRINRSKHQRIFLLSAAREEEQWTFMVQGASGSQYHVKISTVVKCTCPDFRMKQKPCKHIYFIVTQVGQNEELLDYFKNDKKISKNAYTILDSQLHQRLKARMDKPTKDAKDIDLKDDTDCVICFTEMDKETESLEDCGTCKKYFHSQCISAWKAHNPTCPLCRGNLSKDGTADDPLGKLMGVKI